jgi:hypothetical protein
MQKNQEQREEEVREQKDSIENGLIFLHLIKSLFLDNKVK